MIDRKFLEANHAELVAEILAEGKASGHATGLKEGAAAELKRIQDVQAQSLPGHEKLIEQLKFDGKTTGEQAAALVVAAEKAIGATHLKDLREDARGTNASASATGDRTDPTAKADDSLPIEERCKKQWDASAELRAEFGDDYKSFLAVAKAEEAGRVRVLGKRQAA